MFALDFANPYVIYLFMIVVTLLTITWILKSDDMRSLHIALLYGFFTVLLLYSVTSRYIIPYVVDDVVRYPFFPTRIAALLCLLYLVLLRPRWLRPAVFFIASTNILPVFFPMGHPRNIEILNENFLIDHFVGGVMPFAVVKIDGYVPSVKPALISALSLGGIVIAFIPLNEIFQFGNYFFMHEDNFVITRIDWVTEYRFAGMLTIGFIIFFLLYVKIGRHIAHKNKKTQP